MPSSKTPTYFMVQKRRYVPPTWARLSPVPQGDCSILQEDINKLSRWPQRWCVKLQPTKCKIMRRSRKTRHNIYNLYFLDDTALKFVRYTKYLGVTISDDLRWSRHVHHVANRANKLLGLLRRNLFSCSLEVKEAAYFGVVRPLREYASSCWDPHTAQLISELEKVQRRAARFVTGNELRAWPSD